MLCLLKASSGAARDDSAPHRRHAYSDDSRRTSHRAVGLDSSGRCTGPTARLLSRVFRDTDVISCVVGTVMPAGCPLGVPKPDCR
jgi:hypothetical protein